MHVRAPFLAALSGALIALAYPVFGASVDLSALIGVALVPLMLGLGGASPRRGAALGALTGLHFGLLAFTWIVTAMRLHFQAGPLLAVGGWLAHAVSVAAFWAAFGWAFARLRRAGVSPLLAAPAVLVALEAFAPRVFPGPLASALYRHPLWLQSAEVLGAVGVSGLLVAFNVALAEAWRGRGRGRALRLALALPLGAWGYGGMAMARVDGAVASAEALRVGIVQPGVEDPARPEARLERLQARSMALEAQGAELIVWPESGYRQGLLSRAVAGFAPQDAALLGAEHPHAAAPQVGFTTPLLFNAASAHPDSPRRVYNTAWLLDGFGRVALRYDKAALVPFGEYIPLAGPLRRLLGWDLGFKGVERGERLGLGELTLADGRRLRPGVLICYEAVRPELALALGAHRPDLLAVLANDSLFGSAVERELHLALVLPRAIEQRRAIARAGLNGVSAFIDPAGRLTAAARGEGPASLLADLPLVRLRPLAPLTARPLGFAALLFALVGLGRSARSPAQSLGPCIFQDIASRTAPLSRRSM